MAQKLRLAIYDMDRTITVRGTYTPFLLHAARRLAPWRLVLAPVTLFAFAAYGLKLIGRARLKEINQALLLGHVARPKLAKVTDSFAERTLRMNIRQGALDQIAADTAAGWRVVLATASYRLYVEDIAGRLGIEPENVIATNSLSGLDQQVLARIDGENCYGPAKLRMVKAWMIDRRIERAEAEIRFYSDHVSDAPVFEWCDEPVAVSPSPKLKYLAAKRGWRVEQW